MRRDTPSWRARSRVDGMRAPAWSAPSRIARRSPSSIWEPSVPGPSRRTSSSSSTAWLVSTGLTLCCESGSGLCTSSPYHRGMLSTVFALSIVARLPLPMLSIGLLVHTEHLTGSFAAAGVVTAVFAGALGVGGPLLGRAVDRRGHTAVLLSSTAVAGAALVATAALPAGVPAAAPLALAVLLGVSVPPVGACLRTLLPGLAGNGSLEAAYATESTANELTFIAGPPLVLLAGAAWSTGAALVAAAAL